MIYTVVATGINSENKTGFFGVKFIQDIENPTKHLKIQTIFKEVGDDESTDTDIDTSEYNGKTTDSEELTRWGADRIRQMADDSEYRVISIFASGNVMSENKQGVKGAMIDPNIRNLPKTESIDWGKYKDIEDEDERLDAIKELMSDQGLDSKSELFDLTAKALNKALQVARDGGGKADMAKIINDAKDKLVDKLVKARNVGVASIVASSDDSPETLRKKMKDAGVPDEVIEGALSKVADKIAQDGGTTSASENMARVAKYADMIKDMRAKFGDESARKLARSTYHKTKDDALLTAEALVFGADKKKKRTVKNAK